jgi:hypothetical protein
MTKQIRLQLLDSAIELKADADQLLFDKETSSLRTMPELARRAKFFLQFSIESSSLNRKVLRALRELSPKFTD